MLQNEFKKQGDFLFRYRGILPLAILLVGLAVFINRKIQFAERGIAYPEDYFMFICLAVSLAGLVIRIFTVGHTPANTSGRNSKRQLAEGVNKSGIYSIVRHPLYLGNFLIWLGFALLTAHLWFIIAFVFLYWVYYERIMFAEEYFLHKKFNKTYKEWAIKTPAFVPDLTKYRAPSLPFSWKKTLKKEKNGLAAIFITFFIFDFTANLIDGKTEGFPIIFNFWFFAALIAAVIYFILKFLKWETSVLDEPGR